MRVQRKVSVRACEIADIYALATCLRDQDRMEMTCLGLEPRTILRASFRNSILRRAYFVDGELAAVSGLGGELMADIGAPWLMTTQAVARVPVSFVKIAREAVAEMLCHRIRLENVVAASYVGACRLLEVLGFTLEAPQPLGPNSVPFRKFWMCR